MIKTYIEFSDIALMAKTATNLRDRILIWILFKLGCRISEALGLEIKDINFEMGTVTIQHLKSRINLICPRCKARLGKSHSFCSKCGAGVKEPIAKAQEHCRMRTLPLDRETLEMLKDYIDRGGAVSKNGKKYIFGINRHRAWQIIRKCADVAGLPKLNNPETGKIHGVSPHKLRDSFAVRAMKIDDTGDGLRLLQEQLGHTSFNTTAKYRKVAGEELKEWYERIWEQKPLSSGNE